MNSAQRLLSVLVLAAAPCAMLAAQAPTTRGSLHYTVVDANGALRELTLDIGGIVVQARTAERSGVEFTLHDATVRLTTTAGRAAPSGTLGYNGQNADGTLRDLLLIVDRIQLTARTAERTGDTLTLHDATLRVPSEAKVQLETQIVYTGSAVKELPERTSPAAR